jgi:hypothetical protein
LLPKPEAQALLARGGWSQDRTLSFYETDAYASDDGQLLLIPRRGKSKLYPSRAHFVEMIHKIETETPRHLLHGRLPHGERFVEAVPELIDAAALWANVPRDALDRSLDSLALLDRTLARRGIRASLDNPHVFEMLVAYVGEVLRAATDGTWSLERAADPSILEPWILARSGRRHPPFAIVYRELAEPAGGMSLQGAVTGELAQFPIVS